MLHFTYRLQHFVSTRSVGTIHGEKKLLGCNLSYIIYILIGRHFVAVVIRNYRISEVSFRCYTHMWVEYGV
jgi:hypothetical protein